MLIDEFHKLPMLDKPGLIVIGNFDGVHCGHQALLAQARFAAAAHGLQVVAITFEPHPRAFFTPDSAPPRLTAAPFKEFLLKRHGADNVVSLEFNEQLARLPALDFTRFLTANLNARHMLIGPDFIFGHQRQGNAQVLRDQLGSGFVTTFDLITDPHGPVSSTRVRGHIATGDIKAAAQLLGRPHIIYATSGVDGRATSRELLPPAGIYDGFCQKGDEWQENIIEIDENSCISFKNSDFSLQNGAHIAFGSNDMPIFSLNFTF